MRRISHGIVTRWCAHEIDATRPIEVVVAILVALNS
jgi:hypothetical protein